MQAEQQQASSSPSPAATPLPILYAEDTPFSEYSTAVWGRVFNARRDFSRRPAAVVTATRKAHVVEAVKIANEKGWRVSVRSGGHSWAAWSVRDEALLIDLGSMGKGVAGSGNEDGIAYDSKTGVVSVAPARTGREVNGFLAGQIGGPGDDSVEGMGRFFPGGHCPDVGLGGFLLQGGMGWNCKVSLSFGPGTKQTLGGGSLLLKRGKLTKQIELGLGV